MSDPTFPDIDFKVKCLGYGLPLRNFNNDIGCLSKHATKMGSVQENTNVAIIINAVPVLNVSLTATLLNLVSVLRDSNISITIVWILMNAN